MRPWRQSSQSFLAWFPGTAFQEKKQSTALRGITQGDQSNEAAYSHKDQMKGQWKKRLILDSTAEKQRGNMLGQREIWGRKDWRTYKVGERFQAIFHKKAWTLERSKANQMDLRGKESSAAGEERAEKKKETKKEPEGKGNQILESRVEGDRRKWWMRLDKAKNSSAFWSVRFRKNWRSKQKGERQRERWSPL